MSEQAEDRPSWRPRKQRKQRDQQEQPERQQAAAPEPAAGAAPEVTEERNRVASPATWHGVASAGTAAMTTVGGAFGATGLVTAGAVGASAGLGAAAVRKFAPQRAEKMGLKKPDRSRETKGGRDRPGLGARNNGRGGLGKLGGARSGGLGGGLGGGSGAGRGKGLFGKGGGKGPGASGASGKRAGLLGKLAGRGGSKAGPEGSRKGLFGRGKGTGSAGSGTSGSGKGMFGRMMPGRNRAGHGAGSGSKAGSGGGLKGLFGKGGGKGPGGGKSAGLFGKAAGRNSRGSALSRVGGGSGSKTSPKSKGSTRSTSSGWLGRLFGKAAGAAGAASGKQKWPGGPMEDHISVPKEFRGGGAGVGGGSPAAEPAWFGLPKRRKVYPQTGGETETGGHKMPDPFQSHNEALEVTKNGFKFDNANQLIDWVSHAPTAAQVQADMWTRAGEQISEEIHHGDGFGEALAMFGKTQKIQTEVMQEASQVFHRELGAQIEAIRAQDPKKMKWDPSMNR